MARRHQAPGRMLSFIPTQVYAFPNPCPRCMPPVKALEIVAVRKEGSCLYACECREQGLVLVIRRACLILLMDTPGIL